MPRRRKSGRLGVFLNSRLVGQLTREASGAVDFRYDPAWLAWEHTMPVSLSLPLREDRYIGAPVLAVFDNLLPDNAAIRRAVAERVGAGGCAFPRRIAARRSLCPGRTNTKMRVARGYSRYSGFLPEAMTLRATGGAS